MKPDLIFFVVNMMHDENDLSVDNPDWDLIEGRILGISRGDSLDLCHGPECRTSVSYSLDTGLGFECEFYPFPLVLLHVTKEEAVPYFRMFHDGHIETILHTGWPHVFPPDFRPI